MKILIVRTTPNKVNLNTYNLQGIGLAKALIRKGHQVDVAYYGGREKDHFQTLTFDDGLSLNILWWHGWGMFYEGIFPSLKKYVNDYDLVQVTGYVGIISWWLNTHIQDKVVNYNGPYFYEKNRGDILKAKIWDNTLLKLSHRKNMMVITKSKLSEEYMHSKGIDDVTTIGVGLDTSNILAETEGLYEQEFVKRLFDSKGSNKYLLYIGVLEERRNIPFLLEVFAKVLEQNPDYKLVMIGKGKEEYCQMVEQKIDELCLRKSIIMTSRLDQKYMKAVYEVCDAFLLPTRYEIFGMVLLEAMYFGLPVFTTHNGGSGTLMTSENGIVIDELDARKWADKIIEVMENSDKRKKIGENAEKTIKERYTWDALADRFLEVYQRRLGGKK